MSYPRDIDDYSSQELFKEIRRRENALLHNVCPYCHHSLSTHTCKYAGKRDEYHPTGFYAKILKDMLDSVVDHLKELDKQFKKE